MLEIAVDRLDSLSDCPLQIALSGCPPDGEVEISSNRIDFQHRPWRAWGRYRADGEGRVLLSRDAPLDGSYRQADPMGLFWSMVPKGEAPAERQHRDITEPLTVRLAAKANGAETGIALTRRFAAQGVTSETVEERGLVGRLFLPPGPGPHPAMIVLAGSSGGYNLPPAALLASHGYAALALGYFNLPGLPATLDAIPLEYFETAIDWLKDQPGRFGDFVGVTGMSRGGELSLLLGATFPAIRAVVAYVASGLMHSGLTRSRETGLYRPGWTRCGEALPFLQQDNETSDPSVVDWERPPIAITPVFQSQLRDQAAVERATIPVERIRGPVMLISGREDAMWPSVEMSEIAVRRLAAHRHPHPVEHLVYEGAGHLIFPPYAPTTRRNSVHAVLGTDFAFGGTAEGDAAACADSWPRVLSFLQTAVDSVQREASG